MALPVAIRLYDKTTDEDFVFSSWLSSWRNSKWAGVIPNHLFADVTRVAVNQLLGRGAKVLMATNPDDPQQLLGYVCFEPGVIHYCFTKDVVRGLGVATALLLASGTDRAKPFVVSFLTSDARHLGKVIHRPAYARRKEAFDPNRESAHGR